MDTVPFSQVREFIQRQKTAGRYKPATARNLDGACLRIESLLEPPHDTVKFVQEHLDDLVERYGNLHQNVGRGSLEAYKSRTAKAIADYTAHRTDPQWRPDSRRSRAKAGDTTKRQPPQEAAQTRPPAAPPAFNAMTHRLPLRPDFDVEITLPRDLSANEAKRVSTWISVLATQSDGSPND